MLDQFVFIRLILAILIMSIFTNAYSSCVHESFILGSSLIDKKSLGHEIYVLADNNQYIKINKSELNPLRTYHIQEISKTDYSLGDFNEYNKKYIEYYRYSHIQDFLKLAKTNFNKLDYKISTIGKSVEGRNLYSVTPRNYDVNKKTIVMFGRHHGDEGTANWIIEGFIKEFLKEGIDFHNHYQLLLYPMVNPDGAEAQTRYNKNSRDLNRSWHFDPSKSYDEAKIIHTDLKKYLNETKNIVITLDMHGSFTKDFIYRVKKNYVSRDFYNHQQDFIDRLAKGDRFQAGNFILSNGHPMMARIVLINSYQLNALTHETPRDIPLKNANSRSKKSLFTQGKAAFGTIKDMY